MAARDDLLVLLTSADGASVLLRPARYQFPLAPLEPSRAGRWDANWLQIHGHVRTAAGKSWEFDDPCLTTWQARELGGWLRAAAQGEVAVTTSPERDPVRVLEFTEPDLAFSIAARSGEDLVVRVHLSQEAAPARPWPLEHEQQRGPSSRGVLTVALRTNVVDLLAAAGTWQEDLAPFPHR